MSAIGLFDLANGALKWDKLKQAVKDNKKDFDIWDFLDDELGLDTNGKETSDFSRNYIGHLSLKELIENGLKWDQLKQAIKEDSDFDIWDFLGDEEDCEEN